MSSPKSAVNSSKNVSWSNSLLVIARQTRTLTKIHVPRSLSLKWDNLRKELDSFAGMASSCKGGRITIEEFARFLKLPVNPALEELFALFDRVRDHTELLTTEVPFIDSEQNRV